MENHLKILLTTSIVLLIVLDTMLGGVIKTKGRQSQQVMYNVEHSGEKKVFNVNGKYLILALSLKHRIIEMVVYTIQATS
jgi:hypothetical protein